MQMADEGRGLVQKRQAHGGGLAVLRNPPHGSAEEGVRIYYLACYQGQPLVRVSIAQLRMVEFIPLKKPLKRYIIR